VPLEMTDDPGMKDMLRYMIARDEFPDHAYNVINCHLAGDVADKITPDGPADAA
jgi:Mn-containing catalase